MTSDKAVVNKIVHSSVTSSDLAQIVLAPKANSEGNVNPVVVFSYAKPTKSNDGQQGQHNASGELENKIAAWPKEPSDPGKKFSGSSLNLKKGVSTQF